MLAGILGLTLDGGRIYFEKRRAQAAADAGAMGAVHEMRRGNRNFSTQVRPAAVADTGLYGFTDGTSTITVTPTAVGGSVLMNRIEVIVAKQVPTTFMGMFGPSASTVRARAVAGLEIGSDACVLALDQTASPAFKVNGNPTLTADCGIMSNSSASGGMTNRGSGTLSGSWIGVSGTATGGGTYSPAPQGGVLPMWDPLSDFPVPTCTTTGTVTATATSSAFSAGAVFAAANGNGNGGNGNGNGGNGNGNGGNGNGGGGTIDYYNPGTFANEIRITNGTAVFRPGIYCLLGGLKITGGDVTGTELGFYNASPSGQAFEIGGNANVTMSAQTTGAMKGMLVFNRRDAPNPPSGNKIGRGTGSFNLTGSLYFKGQHLDWAGNRGTNAGWTMVIANTIDASGTSDTIINGPTAAESPQVFRALLLE